MTIALRAASVRGASAAGVMAKIFTSPKEADGSDWSSEENATAVAFLLLFLTADHAVSYRGYKDPRAVLADLDARFSASKLPLMALFSYVALSQGVDESDASYIMRARTLLNELSTSPDSALSTAAAKAFALRGMLTPKKGFAYHVPVYQARPANACVVNPTELFDYRHSSVRMCIRQAFGRLKAHFRVLRFANDTVDVEWMKVYSLACVALHNFVSKTNRRGMGYTRKAAELELEENEDLNRRQYRRRRKKDGR